MKVQLTEELDIPQGINVTAKQGTFHIKGPKGEVTRVLHSPRIESKVEGSTIVFNSKGATQREKKLVMTYIAHLKTAFKGTTKGHTYKLKVCSSHFPMTVALKGSQLEIKNYFGEQTPRHVTIPQGVTCKVSGAEIVLEGASKELTGQTAATIELSTKRPGFDKRIFQDGIFITEKDGEAFE